MTAAVLGNHDHDEGYGAEMTTMLRGVGVHVLDGESVEQVRFRDLMAHEYVEGRLMERGIPYRSAHPDAWDDGSWPTSDHHGAHDLAPLASATRGPFAHWPMLGREIPEITIAKDLSNLDLIVELAARGWRDEFG